MTPQAAKVWHGFWVAIGMGVATVLETRFLTGLPDTVAAWRGLLESMDGVDYRAHCPHGRPVLLRLSISEIERRFGRT